MNHLPFEHAALHLGEPGGHLLPDGASRLSALVRVMGRATPQPTTCDCLVVYTVLLQLIVYKYSVPVAIQWGRVAHCVLYMTGTGTL